MEIVVCDSHRTRCLLKTGVRDGPNKGKSFYVCSAAKGTPCGFTQEAEIPPSHCLHHVESVVDLQALVPAQQLNCYRLFFRCVLGRSEGKKWCGSIPWKDAKSEGRSPPSDGESQCASHPQERNPFKAPCKTGQPSEWRILQEGRHGRQDREREKQKGEGGRESQRGERERVGRKEGKEKDHVNGEKVGDSQKGERKSEKEEGKREKEKGKRQSDNQKEERVRQKTAEDGEKVPSKQEKEKGKPESESRKEERERKNEKRESKGERSGRTEMGPRESKGEEGEKERETESGGLEGKASVSESWRSRELPAGMRLKKRASGEPSEEVQGGSRAGTSPHPNNREEEGTAGIARGQAEQHAEKGKEGEQEPESVGVRGSSERQDVIPCKEPSVKARALGQQSQDGGDSLRETEAKSRKDDEDVDDDVQVVSVHPGPKQTPPQAAAPVQKTITSFPGFQRTSQAQGPPGDPHALHSQLSIQLRQKKAMLSVVNVSALPDKGERLKTQVQELEDALESLSLTAAPPADINRQESQDGGMTNQMPTPTPSNPFARPGGTILLPFPAPLQAPPSSLGLQLSQGISQSYGYGVPQDGGLYGGRMTENRLLAVKNATTEAINHLHHSLESCPAPHAEAADPKGIKVQLLPHQKQALAWLLWRETQTPCGGILADDMGLGKTLTMIALILAQRKKKKEEKEEKEKESEGWLSKSDSLLVSSHGTLVICPASLIHHWKKEIERHVKSSRLSVYLYHGPSRQKNAKLLAEHDVVVTTYSLVSKEIPAQKEDAEKPTLDTEEVAADLPPLLRVSWARVILDEAHNIKNPKVQTSMAVCKLRAQARWAVTGTPIQNNLLDMYSLLKFLRCSPFDEYKLWKAQVDNGSKRGGERLNVLTRTLLLRRTKDQSDSSGKPLVSLPDRTCEVHRIKLSEDEQSVYDVVFAQSRSTLQSYLKRHEGGDSKKDTPGNPFEKVAREFGVSQSGPLPSSQQSQASSAVHILSLLLRLRQCCCHLSLLKKTLDQSEMQEDGITLSLEEQLSALCLSEPTGPDPKDTVSLNGSRFPSEIFNDTRESTKISAVLSELKAIRERCESQKSVIVSQWTSMLRIVAIHLKKLGLRFATIDGTVQPKNRMELVEEFNTNPKGPQVMLVSLCAGGVGINLTGGNHLFLLDMHWNPALEDQACDRIYRVGQCRDVTIHRFVCEGTVEDKISSLQEKKKELASKVLSGTGNSFTKLSLADLRIIFGV
ncbi:hypothetical protein JZ751_029178 [Albula glossodonta]|uniref:Transcription termination factor 2 n=1 Tax=Albula glossodonta TaxID=121402 RepID=A0A8T2PCB8_9TELE|nr:hypothetical protein JZ751_029178 [Albula glossodonta]